MIGVGLALLLLAAPERDVLASLDELDRALLAAERRLEQLDDRRLSLQKELAHLEAEEAAAALERRGAFERFSRRLQALTRLPTGSRLVLLGGAGSLADYLEMSRLLRFVTASDRRLHERLATADERLQQVAHTLEDQRRELLGLADAARAERDALAARRQERVDLLAVVAKDRRLSALERTQAGAALAETVRKLTPAGRQSRNFAGNRGRLPWPAVGPLEARFGQLGADGAAVAQNGLAIRAKAGARVQAIAAGRVVFADWLRGYGQLVIVDHGDGFHALVAHLGSVAVKVGAEVEAQSELGTVGDTGSLDGTLLYFELREHGTPIDPLPWLRR